MDMWRERKWGDPVRVKASFTTHAKREDGIVLPECRQFSLDPQLTTFEILHSLLSRAFDIQSEFLIQYRVEDSSGQEIFVHLISDWDLEAAFDRAADPYLCLRIDPVPIEHTVEEWDLVNIPLGSHKPVPPKEVRTDPTLQTKILTKVEKTITLMQQALNFNTSNSDEFSAGVSTTPLSDAEFVEYRDGVGTLIKTENCRKRIFQGGLEPSLRRVVWKHLLNVYPDGLNGSERMRYMSRKTEEYQRLKSQWMVHYSIKKMSEELKTVTGMVKKDVLRTDRQHPYYGGGDDNPNVEQLFNILTTYSIYHPSTGYCQGMSDMASPILYVMGNEAHAYIAFTALMERLKDNFTTSGATMTLKFEHLASALAYHDPVFFTYLQRHHAIDLLFCYRWLLLEMKREFAFDDALRMLEVTWSSLPCKPRQDELALFERIPELNPVSQPIPLPRTKESVYTKVCALRRQSSSPASCSHDSFHDQGKIVAASPRMRKNCHSLSFSHSKESHESAGDNDLDDVFGPSESNGTSKSNTISADQCHRPCAQFDGKFSSSLSQVNNSDALCPTAANDFNLTLDVQKQQPSCLKPVDDGSLDGVSMDEIPDSQAEEVPLLQGFEIIASCEEAMESTIVQPSSSSSIAPNKPSNVHPMTGGIIRPSLPPPDVLGCGNPFLIFLCVTLLLQHRDFIMARSLDSTSLAMHFDRLVRKHNVERVLSQARTLYYRYLDHFKNEKNQSESLKKNLVGV